MSQENQNSVTELQALIDRVRRWGIENTGNEPSVSCFHRALDELVAFYSSALHAARQTIFMTKIMGSDKLVKGLQQYADGDFVTLSQHIKTEPDFWEWLKGKAPKVEQVSGSDEPVAQRVTEQDLFEIVNSFNKWFARVDIGIPGTIIYFDREVMPIYLNNEGRPLLAKLNAHPSPNKADTHWQPIENAPMDGTRFDVFYDNLERISDCYFDEGVLMCGYEIEHYRVEDQHLASHFLMVPPLPDNG